MNELIHTSSWWTWFFFCTVQTRKLFSNRQQYFESPLYLTPHTHINTLTIYKCLIVSTIIEFQRDTLEIVCQQRVHAISVQCAEFLRKSHARRRCQVNAHFYNCVSIFYDINGKLKIYLNYEHFCSMSRRGHDSIQLDL